jgi:hypothetical protein
MGIFFLIYLSQWQRKLLYRLIHSQLLAMLFSYSITINNVKIIYNSGVDTVDTSYANAATTPHNKATTYWEYS